MKKTIQSIFVIFLATAFLAACAAVPSATSQPAANTPVAQTTQALTGVGTSSDLSASSLQQAYMQVYQDANPSVVNIQVIQNASTTQSQSFNLPGLPQLQSPQTSPSQVEGSGFVYDTNGNCDFAHLYCGEISKGKRL